MAQEDPQPGTVPWTPVISDGLVRTAITVPPQYASVGLNPTDHSLNIPEGWSASIFFAGNRLDKARFMTWGPDSVLYVANYDANEILAMPDFDGDGIADDAVVAVNTAPRTNDVRFYRDTMWVVSESRIEKRWRSNPDGFDYDNSVVVIDKASQPNQIGGNHRTRTLVLDTINMKLYLSVGSRGNADRESNRAVIEEYDWDGSNRRVYASGVRNAVGMTLHPRTGALWANNNGSDLQGNNIPPEWVYIVREDGFYGYPIAYHHQAYFNFDHPSYEDLLPITSDDSARVNTMVPPAALVTAHCAPMALVFANVDRPGFPKSGAFMSMRGSWNRQPLAGAKIVYFQFDNDEDTIANAVVDFCTGFMRDSNNVQTRWARPVGLALAADGSVYVTSDDIKQFILKLTPPPPTSVDEDTDDRSSLNVYPNPALESVSIQTEMITRGAQIEVYDLSNRKVSLQELRRSADSVQFNVSSLSAGTYVVSVSIGDQRAQKMFTISGR